MKLVFSIKNTIVLILLAITMLLAFQATRHITRVETATEPKSDNHAFCVETLTTALSKSTLTSPLKDLLTLFVSKLTKQSIDAMIKKSRSERLVLISNAKHLSSVMSGSQCASDLSTVTVGVCTVFDGVHHNFQEWMLHYLFLGVSQIIIFDTSIPASAASINLISDTQPFVELGFVKLIHRFRSINESIDDIQMESFKQCYQNDLKHLTFIASFDADEFLVLKNATCLNTFMEAYTEYGGLRVPWRTMSPTGVVKHDPKRTFMSQYIYAFKVEPFPMPHHVKTIGKVQYFENLWNQHFIVSTGREQVDSKGVPGNGPFIEVTERMFDEIELRHYYATDWLMFVYEKVCGSGQGRVTHSAFRANLLVSILESIDGTEAVESNGGRKYALDKLFEEIEA